jgi:hypothetical protein
MRTEGASQGAVDGKAVPYGMYDLVHNSGFINIGIDHETAEFAVESLRRWWKIIGSILYPTNKEVLIVANGGGSNGARNRQWKQQLQQFANETGLVITIYHLPRFNSLWMASLDYLIYGYLGGNMLMRRPQRKAARSENDHQTDVVIVFCEEHQWERRISGKQPLSLCGLV